MKYNVTIGLILFALSIIVSQKIASKFTLKRKFYQELREFNKKLEVEVEYTKRPIEKIINNFNGLAHEVINSYLISKNKVDENFYSFLTREEINDVYSYLDEIGKYDGKTQLSVLKAKDAVINEKLIKAKENEEKFKPLYVKLGFFVGLIIFIIFL